MMDMSVVMVVFMGVMMVAMMGGAAWVFVRKIVQRKPKRERDRSDG